MKLQCQVCKGRTAHTKIKHGVYDCDVCGNENNPQMVTSQMTRQQDKGSCPICQAPYELSKFAVSRDETYCEHCGNNPEEPIVKRVQEEAEDSPIRVERLAMMSDKTQRCKHGIFWEHTPCQKCREEFEKVSIINAA